MALSNINKNGIVSRLTWFTNRTKWEKSIIVIIVFIFLGISVYKVFGQQSKTPLYETSQAQTGSVISSVSESGNVTAGAQVTVTSPSTGIIDEVYVKNGDKVTAGQNLFKVKAVATPAQQSSAYASYLSALSSAQSAQQSKQSLQAQLEKDRQSILDAQNAVDNKNNNPINPSTKQTYTALEQQSVDSSLTNARESFTADESKYAQSDTAIAAANASLNTASLNYQATKDAIVTAPTDGTVANLAVSSGSSVTASGNSSSSTTTSNSSSSSSNSNTTSNGSTVLVLGDFTKLSIVSQVNEVDISKIKPNQKATITLDAFTGKTYVGKVVSVDSIGTATSGVVTYNVYIDLIAPPAEIHSGMTASVIIQTDRHDDVISVPTTAVQTATDGTKYVRVLKNGKVTQVTVTTGIASDTDTEITTGLNDGDVVATSIATQSSSVSNTSSPFSGLGGRGFGGVGGGGGVSTNRNTNATRGN